MRKGDPVFCRREQSCELAGVLPREFKVLAFLLRGGGDPTHSFFWGNFLIPAKSAKSAYLVHTATYDAFRFDESAFTAVVGPTSAQRSPINSDFALRPVCGVLTPAPRDYSMMITALATRLG
jgi:hypothetical protein